MVDTSALGEERSRFLSEHMNPVLHDLVTDIICHQPSEPLKFMQAWLQKRLGRPSDFAIDMQRLKTVARDKQVEALKQENKTLHATLQNMGQRVQECSDFVNAPEKSAAEIVEGEEKAEVEEEGEEEEYLDDSQVPVPRKRGMAISAETFGDANPRTAIVPPVHPKTDDERLRLLQTLEQSFLWNGCADAVKEILLNALEPVAASKGRRVVEENEEADCMYVVDSGKLECFKVLEGNPDEQLVRTLEPGLILGENCLTDMAQRRAVAVVAAEDSVLYKLERTVWRAVQQDHALRQRTQLQKHLRRIPMFFSLTEAEISQLVDALKLQHFEEMAKVTEQKQPGDCLYLVASGSLSVIENGVETTTYTIGDYWGELALVFDHPRPATVKVLSETASCYCLSRENFNALIGPMPLVLARNLVLQEFP
ncbi:unnamed protein product [Amoebophrya sp. A120]|nr:unnamed protein product [Amoebophrya sp. A120]|eukprot:GSA120T00018685001.1